MHDSHGNTLLVCSLALSRFVFCTPFPGLAPFMHAQITATAHFKASMLPCNCCATTAWHGLATRCSTSKRFCASPLAPLQCSPWWPKANRSSICNAHTPVQQPTPKLHFSSSITVIGEAASALVATAMGASTSETVCTTQVPKFRSGVMIWAVRSPQVTIDAGPLPSNSCGYRCVCVCARLRVSRCFQGQSCMHTYAWACKLYTRMLAGSAQKKPF